MAIIFTNARAIEDTLRATQLHNQAPDCLIQGSLRYIEGDYPAHYPVPAIPNPRSDLVYNYVLNRYYPYD